ncbi:Signal transduction histidine kinase [Pseudomonas lundensis]|jgi:signal transduction histidine kinase|uniref:ATP-binding protein n=1 Tax=Pseudomonas lundensis TaxID=86185 RepID=UPI00088D62C9|nr:ATP-binding protein [Pseudomonas lundensis]MBM1184089.1 ATP-binding protein [Pseudomonas lundensis]NNA24233.1 ATP-binding protein [Pseudomonas lundensis]SDQ59231.1 Signal transduction histidine kinase [Pseudomonas lundensis]
MRSIQRRLSLGLVSVLLVAGLVVGQVSLWLFETGLQRYLESGLQNDSENLLIALSRGPQGLQLDERRLAPAYQRPFSGHYFSIEFGDIHWRSRSLWDSQLPKTAKPGLSSKLQLGPDNQMLLVLRSEYKRLGQVVSITVAQDYSPIRASLKQVQRIGLAMGVAALIIILMLQRVTVQRALRPLEIARKQIAQLQQGQRSQLDAQVPLELEPLVTQINHLLAHTEDTLKRSRNALGNLGHALKTPLAVLMSLTNDPRLAAYPEIQRTLHDQLEHIEQRMNRELNRARLAGDALPGAQFDADAELPALLATLSMIHGQHLAITFDSPPNLHLPWDREDMLELLGNLLDNACKWADARVELRLRQTEVGYDIQVQDDGPGIPEGERDQVVSRGTRLDEQTAGHGLGLGIVRDIVDAWGASMQLTTGEWGGLLVTIELVHPANGATTA